LQSVQFHFIWRRRQIVDFSVFSLGCLRQFLAESLHAAADWVFFSFARLSLGSFSPLFLSAFSVGSFSRLFSLVSSLQRHFLLVTFDENASNGSIWKRLNVCRQSIRQHGGVSTSDSSGSISTWDTVLQ
jgi:hypothetical protein